MANKIVKNKKQYMLGGQGALNSRAGDETALEALYTSTNGSSWTDNTGWASSGMSLSDNIYGVTVEYVNNDGELRVTEIDLKDNGLTGSIDIPEFNNLKKMELFVVYVNSLNSTIPQELLNLANQSMKYCYLGMTSNDPEAVNDYPHNATQTGSGIVHVGKSKGNENNVFTGTIPAPPDPANSVLEWFFCNWTDSAEGAEDGITGFDPAILNMPSLVGLQIYENWNIGASGNSYEFPDLRGCPNLRIWAVAGGSGTDFDADVNGFFTGDVGSKIDGLANLLMFDFSSHSDLTFQPDAVDWSNHDTLLTIESVSNTCTGGIPAKPFDGTLNNFEAFIVNWPQNDTLTGTIPTVSTDLQEFTCVNHSLEGEIPSGIFHNSTQLINTHFGWNNFTSIGTDDLTNLGDGYWKIRNLRWQINEISGRLPVLAFDQPNNNLEDLSRVYINNNKYTFSDFLWVPSVHNPNNKPCFELYADLYDANNVFDDFTYGNQKNFGSTNDYDSGTSTIDFSGSVSHGDNSYTWYRNGSVISGETSNSLDVSGYNAGDDFYLEVTNSTFNSIISNSSLTTGLTLTSITITI